MPYLVLVTIAIGTITRAAAITTIVVIPARATEGLLAAAIRIEEIKLVMFVKPGSPGFSVS